MDCVIWIAHTVFLLCGASLPSTPKMKFALSEDTDPPSPQGNSFPTFQIDMNSVFCNGAVTRKLRLIILSNNWTKLLVISSIWSWKSMSFHHIECLNEIKPLLFVTDAYWWKCNVFDISWHTCNIQCQLMCNFIMKQTFSKWVWLDSKTVKNWSVLPFLELYFN